MSRTAQEFPPRPIRESDMGGLKRARWSAAGQRSGGRCPGHAALDGADVCHRGSGDRHLRQKHRAIRGVPGVRYAVTARPCPEWAGRLDQIGGARLHPGVFSTTSARTTPAPTASPLPITTGSLAAVSAWAARGRNIVVVTASGMSWAWMVPLLRGATPLTFSVSSADIMEATPLAGAPTR